MRGGIEGRRIFTAEQKFKVVKEALTTDLGVSGVCKRHGISATVFYQWQEKFLLGAREGLERKSSGVSSAEQRKLENQAKELDRMKGVIAEITAENVAFKKSFGDL